MKLKKGAVLIEVLVALFITAIVFIAVYTTISISLINSRYLQQARETSEFASQLVEAFSAADDNSDYSIFDHIKNVYGRIAGVVEIDLEQATSDINLHRMNGDEIVDYRDLIDNDTLTEYKVQLFLISSNSVFISENSLGTPFGSGIYTPDEELMTFELRVQRNSQDWGQNGYRFYKERQPVVISYIFQVHRGKS